MVKHGAPPSHLTAKTVAVAFVLAVLVFAGILLLPLLLESLPKDNTPAETDAPTGRVRQYALLFREAEGDLTGAVWLTADTRTCTMEAVGYPPQTEVAGDSGPATLSALFAADGSTAAAAALGDAVGGAPDGTLTFSVSGVAAFVNYL